jgi:hypothetical protein
VYGNIIFYMRYQFCEKKNEEMSNVLVNVIILLYVRLIKLICILLVLVLCSPFIVTFFICRCFRRPDRDARIGFSRKLVINSYLKWRQIYAYLNEANDDQARHVLEFTCSICLDDFTDNQ